jgi:hypothetical protein
VKLVTVKKNANNADLQKSIERILPVAYNQPEAKRLAQQLRGSTDFQTARNIFDWVLTNIKYRKDGEHQIVRLPSGILRTREGDCKSMTVLVCSLLKNNGINPVLVYTSYREDPTPTHVYCQTEGGIILDPVWGRFNSEKKPRRKFVKSTNSMNISYLAGIGAKPRKPLVNLKKVVPVLKQVAPPILIGRALFLTIIRNNLDGIATKLSTGNRENQIATWKRAGGDGKALGEAIAKGASKPAKKVGFLGKLKGRLKKKKIGFIGAVETDDDALKAGIASVATSLGAALGSVIPGAGTAAGGGAGAALGGVMVAVLPIVKEAIAKTADSDILPEQAPITPPADIVAPPAEVIPQVSAPPAAAAAPASAATPQFVQPPAPAPSPAPDKTKTMLLVGGAALAAFLLLKK